MGETSGKGRGMRAALRKALRPRAAPVWRSARLLAASVPLAAALSGCAGRSETAWDLMRQQKEEQAMVRRHEDELARRQAPARPDVMLSLIREAQSQGRYFASLAYVEAYQQQFGASPELQALRADALRMTGQPAQSEAAYRALLSTGQAAQGWHGLGLLAAARGDYAQAAADMARAARLAPTDALVLSDLGYASLRAGDPAGARIPLGKAAELAPGNHKVLGNLALLLMAEGDEQGARRVMDQAGLSDAARAQVERLAGELRAGANAAAASPAMSAIARQQPLLDRFGRPASLR